jgi:hypothetical protein
VNVHGPTQEVDEFALVVVVGAGAVVGVVVLVETFAASVTLTTALGAVPPFPFTTRDRTIVLFLADLLPPSLSLTFAVPLVQLTVTGVPCPPKMQVEAPLTFAVSVTKPPAADR